MVFVSDSVPLVNGTGWYCVPDSEKMKTLKILCAVFLVISMLLSKQRTAGRKFPTDWSGSDSQVNIQIKELVISVVMDIYMNAKDRQPEIYSAEIKYKKPEQRGSTGHRYFDEAEAYWKILAEYEYAIKSIIETYVNGVWEDETYDMEH